MPLMFVTLLASSPLKFISVSPLHPANIYDASVIPVTLISAVFISLPNHGALSYPVFSENSPVPSTVSFPSSSIVHVIFPYLPLLLSSLIIRILSFRFNGNSVISCPFESFQ